jgi:hypothetical protein
MEKVKEETVKKERNSNFELMRIVSMFMIVVYHFIVHGGVLTNSYGLSNLFFNMVIAIIFVHVNSFVLLSGYFNHDKQLKFGKALKLNNTVWFYTAIISIIFFSVGADISKLSLFHDLLPISYGSYWFFTCYLMLFLISPILNIVIANSNKFRLRKIIVGCFILISILPILTKNAFFNSGNGFSLSSFILLYFIGAYLNKYPIQHSYFLKVFTRDAKRLVFVVAFFCLAVLNFLLNYLGTGLQHFGNSLVVDIGGILTNAFVSYSNPILILQSICYILFFETVCINSNFINKIASCTFGVYLITDNIYVREWIYKALGFDRVIYGIDIILYIILFSLSLFIIATTFEVIRQFLFKIIYNSKLANKNRVWYRNYLKSLGLNINW